MKAPGAEPVLHDRDNTLKMHVGFQLPTVEEVASVSERVERIQHVPSTISRGRACRLTMLTPNSALLTDAFRSLRCACGAAKRGR